MKGKLYGDSVGPGDPKLMTIRSKEVLECCNVIGYPVKKAGERSAALSIIGRIVDLEGRDVREFVFSMNPIDEIRREHEKIAIGELLSILEEGKDVALITLGDVSIYSTYMYVDRAVREAGFETEIIPGINSFSHGAALANLPLTLGDEGLCIVPMAKDREDLLDVTLKNFENIVIMKAYKSMDRISRSMEFNGIPTHHATVMSNIGMDDEYVGPLDPDRDYGYFTTVLIKRSV